MKSKGQKLILISFFLALLATAVLFLYMQNAKSSKPIEKNTSILVAAENIPPRTLIEKKMIKEVQVPDNSIFKEYLKDYSTIVGKYSKESILKDEGFLKDKLISDNGNDLSLNLDKDHRAISLNVSQDAGVAELIKPGDFVDIVTFLGEKKDGAKVLRPEIAKIVLQNIEVVAIDNKLNREDNTKVEAKTANNFLITLSVQASDIEKLVLAQSIGSIKLALRPLKSDGSINTNGTTWEQLIVEEPSTDSSEGNIASSNSNSSWDKYKIYTVKRGDTLRKISTYFYGTPDNSNLIKNSNNIGDGNLIVTGEVIKIPIQN